MRRAALVGAILGPACGWSLVGIGRVFGGHPPVLAFKAWLNVSVIFAPFSLNALARDTTPIPGHEVSFTVVQAFLNGLLYAAGGGLSLAVRRWPAGRWTLRGLALVWIVGTALLIWVRGAWRPAP